MSEQSRSGPAISLPTGGGAVQGIGETFQPDLFTGTGNFTVPITTSPGRAGFGPHLSLQYSTGHGNGPFGLGWQLSLPRITCKTEKGLPRYDESDVFILSGAEDLVVQYQPNSLAADVRRDGAFTMTRYRPRMEGLFARIERWVRDDGDVHWRATTKDNVTSIYGRTPAARINDPDKPARVYEWLLEETFDAKGNHILYEYARDEAGPTTPGIYETNHTYAQLYIRRIYYANSPTTVGPKRPGTENRAPHSVVDRHYLLEVVFDYGDLPRPPADPYTAPPASGQESTGAWRPRDDPFSSFRPGFELRTLRRCERVLMFHHFAELGGATLVRSTDFTYNTDPHTRLSFLSAVQATGYRKSRGQYLVASLPPVEFRYSQFRPQEQRYQSLRAVGDELPSTSLLDPELALVDISSDGLPEIVHAGAAGFRYWRNLGDGLVDRPHPMHESPAGIRLADPGVAFTDTGGDGRPDLAVHSGSLKGFYEVTPAGTWEPFKAYATFPTIDSSDAEARLIDLTGDGRADLLITREHHFLWLESRGEDGFAEPQYTERVPDLDAFPDVYFGEPHGRVRLADLNGDGLDDIVLLHDGRVDYWPNQGYGQFGRRITMTNAPRMGRDFDPRRLFLVDLDGSGCADLVQVGFDQVRFWFNQSGNGWSGEQVVPGTPLTTDATAVQFADVFGSGTATLLWSYDAGLQARERLKALDFCGGQKPYLLVEMSNNLGAATRVRYGSSTRHALADERRGEPWVTHLPFPVHVVDTVETIDHIARTKLVRTFTYHHGYYDGREREFRGFGRVEQTDSEEFTAFSQPGLHDGPDRFTNKARAYHVPPALTKSWFHTGAYFDQMPLAQRYRNEYYRGDDRAFALDDHEVEPGSTPQDAFRALSGALLRTEVYALDGTEKQGHPYSVTVNAYRVVQVQPRAGNQHAVYLRTARESVNYVYERNPADPRISHDLTLRTDAYGSVIDRATVWYPRRAPPLTGPLSPEQATLRATYDRARFINEVGAADHYFVGIPCERQTYEITGLAWPGTDPLQPVRAQAFDAVLARPGQPDPFEAYHWQRPDDLIGLRKRILKWTRTYFRPDSAARELDEPDDLRHRLPLGAIESRGLPYESYRAAFTTDLLTTLYGGRVSHAMLAAAGYRQEPGEPDYWWIPAGRQAFRPDAFYVADRHRDAFGNVAQTTYDRYALLVESTVASVNAPRLDNTVRAENDYRVLQPTQITDPNLNRTRVAFDALGFVVGTAVMGKEADAAAGRPEGDSLAAFDPDPPRATLDAYFQDPRAHAQALLGSATTRVVYDPWRYYGTRTLGPDRETGGRPNVVATISRETHASDLAAGGQTAVQQKLVYADGFGREVQTKVQAEPGLVGTTLVSGRWVGTGWTIFNNKGQPVKRYEPFLSATHRFEAETVRGVSPSLFYDPLGRVVLTLQPNHAYAKVVFDPWRQATWDENDTVAQVDPAGDPDVGTFFTNLDAAEYLPTWLGARADGSRGEAEKDAAEKAARHAGTPTITHLDSLGRVYLTVADNGARGQYATHLGFDIEGNDLAITDPRSVEVARHWFDMTGRKLRVDSVDAGIRPTFYDVGNAPLLAWDARGYRVRLVYDRLRRPRETWVMPPGGAELLVQKSVYGEQLANPERGNHRGREYQTFDGAGAASIARYDFKGRPAETTRRLAREFRDQTDWSALGGLDDVALVQARSDTQLEAETFRATTRCDALNRVVESITPDGSRYVPGYNAAGFLETVQVYLRGSGSATDFVLDIDYDEQGQRKRLEYANGVVTTHTYDSWTRRLIRTVSRRADGSLVEDLAYTYDPVGNITCLADGAFDTVFNNNQRIDPAWRYEYDATYRLVRAGGREHESVTPCHYRRGDAKHTELVWLSQPLTNARALQNYEETYDYDAGNNLVRIRHHAGSGGWTREQTYASGSNRLVTTEATACDPPFPFYRDHDANGNVTALPHLPALSWDHADRLREVDLGSTTGGAADRAYYTYDGGGARVRKLVERGANREERIYLGPYEIYREYSGTTVTFERETLHVIDGQRRLALVETRTVDTRGREAGQPGTRVRYQLSNHLQSSLVELDDSSHARLISLEEYYPYGGTAYLAGRSQIEVHHKRYRYAGKERDDETGLEYYGARYYAPWLGRWLSCDPAGLVDGTNLYAFVRCSPTVWDDREGLNAHTPEMRRAAELEATRTELAQTSAELGRLRQELPGKEQLLPRLEADLAETVRQMATEGRPTQGLTRAELERRIAESAEELRQIDERVRGAGKPASQIEVVPRHGMIPPITLEHDRAAAARNFLQDMVALVQTDEVERLRMEIESDRQAIAQQGDRVAELETAVRNLENPPPRNGPGRPAPRGYIILPDLPPLENDPAITARTTSRALGAAGMVLAAEDIYIKTSETGAEKGLLMGVAQANKTMAMHTVAFLWFTAGGAVALAVYTGGIASPLAATAIGTAVATTGTYLTQSSIDAATPDLR
jgi:RHS repeat-associated protein